ncbi:hypothetical protein REPUB_Repub15cG0047800 [Reevesia pubescens]
MASTSAGLNPPNPNKEIKNGLLHIVESFKHVVAAFLNFLMATIATIIGHASFAKFVLALYHNCVIIRRDRGVLYMAEKMKGDEAEKRGIMEAAYDSEDEVREASVRMGRNWLRESGTMRCTRRLGKGCIRSFVPSWGWLQSHLLLPGFDSFQHPKLMALFDLVVNEYLNNPMLF